MDGCKFSLICLIVVFSVIEVWCETTLSPIDTGDASVHKQSPNVTDAVSKAANYLLNRTLLEDGLKDFLPRTAVALAFAAESGSIPKNSLTLLKEELNNHISTRLSQEHLKPSSIELAHYINALVATCQDPSNFQGKNLVKQLRIEIRGKEFFHFSSPFDLQSLCTCTAADAFVYKLTRLPWMFFRTEELGLKAYVIMAMACPIEENSEYRNSLTFKIFKSRVESSFKNANIYTKALSLQALHAMGVNDTANKLSELLETQLPDGSFGDLLSTYYAIPALLGKSLAHLKRESSSVIVESSPLLLRESLGEVVYSLWIEQGAQSMTHSLKIQLDLNDTFYDVMRKAEEMNDIFSFRYDSTWIGKKIYYLAFVPNDVESGKVWNLFRGSKGNNTIFSEENLSEVTEGAYRPGVDRIWPQDGDVFVFWFSPVRAKPPCKS